MENAELSSACAASASCAAVRIVPMPTTAQGARHAPRPRGAGGIAARECELDGADAAGVQRIDDRRRVRGSGASDDGNDCPG